MYIFFDCNSSVLKIKFLFIKSKINRFADEKLIETKIISCQKLNSKKCLNIIT